MVTTSHVVQKLMNDDVSLQEAIIKKIVNFSLLAKYLKSDVENELGRKTSLKSIMMALRRYAEKLEEWHKYHDPNFFNGIRLDNDIIYIVVHKSPNMIDKLQRLYYEIDLNEGGFFNILQGNREIGIIANKEFEDKILDILGEEKITHVMDEHVSISLNHSKDYSLTPGIIYGVSRNLAWRNINVITWLHTPTELTLIVHENHATKCYNIFQNMLKEHKNNNSDIFKNHQIKKIV